MSFRRLRPTYIYLTQLYVCVRWSCCTDGEGFDYDTASADYWLTEISGLPSGLSSDMLRYNTMRHTHGFTRYHYRGMLVGSAFRYTGSHAGSAPDVFSPVATWQLWDEFKIQESTMIGWWENHEESAGTVPVHLSNPNFLATVYLRYGLSALVVVSDWSSLLGNYTSALSVSYNWTAMGFAASTVAVPRLPPYQVESSVAGQHFPVSHTFNISASQGGLILLLEKP